MLLYKKLPLYFFPTTVIFLDDDNSFLKALRFNLEYGFFIFNKFTNIDSFIKHIKANSSKEKEGFINRTIEDGYDHIGVDINVNDIYKKIYDKKRHQTISTIVADYHLGVKNGIDILKEITNSFKKILLTGVADETTAIKAINREYIDSYIKKQDSNLAENLNKQIIQSQAYYFSEKGEKFLEQLHNIKYSDTILDVIEYIKIFNAIVKKYQIVEGYLLDPTGSYLFIDANGENYCLLAYTESQMFANQDTVHLENLSSNKRRMIREKQSIFYPKPELFKHTALFPVNCEKCQNGQEFYYSLIKGEFNFSKRITLHRYSCAL